MAELAAPMVKKSQTMMYASTLQAPWLVVTGLDGAGKTTLVHELTASRGAHRFRLPYHDFVKSSLSRSGQGLPWGDALTDRLLFATDARLTNYLIREWRSTQSLLISQRGWMDNYIFGAVQGVAYEQTAALLETAELERPAAIIYLITEPTIAFDRIRHDPHRDKYETLEFMLIQHRETLRFYQAVQSGLPILAPFAGIPTILIETSHKTEQAVFTEAERFLAGVATLPHCLSPSSGVDSGRASRRL
jgi:thymidylate kinase